ncbi:MAG: hypothetical protein IT342_01605 [Candidatus Melainabacteria bacterium]|nr:hypothetical protein [Candidatus Melainabacteria bacterium]
MANSTAPAATNEKAVDDPNKKKDPVADGQDDAAEVEGTEEQKPDKLNEQGVAATYTEGAERPVAQADGTAVANVPKADITADAITFTPPEEKKDGGVFGFMGRMAKGAWDGITGLVKGAYEAAAGVVNSVLDNVWKKEFGAEAQLKVTEKDGKVTHMTATDGVGRGSRVIDSDGKVTTMQDGRGNTTHYDSTTGKTYVTDRDGGKISRDEATGVTTYEAKDGSKVIQHKDGRKEFLDKSGRVMEQGDRTLRMQFDKISRVINDKGVIDTVKGYHEGAIKVFRHGNVAPESVPETERNAPGVHQYGTQTEKVEDDGFKTIHGKDGRTRFGHSRDGREWEMRRGEDGRPELWRDGKKVDFSDLPERMRKRFEALRNGTSETRVDGVTQVHLSTNPEGKPATTIGDVTLTNTPEGVKTEVQTGPKPEDKVVYTNRNDGTQTGPGSKDGLESVYNSDDKENPYKEVDAEGNTVLTYDAETNRLWTPEFTSTPEGIQLADGNFIHTDGSVTNSDGQTIMASSGYSSSSPEYQFANAQVVTAVGSTNNIIGQARGNPAGMSESAIEGCISDLGKALAQCIKTGNYERLNQIFGAIADAYGALAEVKVAKAREQQRQYAIANADDDFERLNAANRVA